LIISLFSCVILCESNSINLLGYSSTTCTTTIGSITINENQCYSNYSCPVATCGVTDNCASQNSDLATFRSCVGCKVSATGSLIYRGQGTGFTLTEFSDTQCNTVLATGSQNYGLCTTNTGSNCILGQMFTSKASGVGPVHLMMTTIITAGILIISTF